MTRRLWIGLVFTVPIVLLAMGGATLFGSLSPRTNQWLQLVLSIPAVFWAGGPFLARAVTSVRTRNLNMFTLIGLGVSAAWAFSAAVTCVPAMFPIGHLSANALAPVYFEAAAVIIVLTLVGQVLELRARAKTQSAVLGLLELAPPVALRLSGADEQEVPVHEVRSGDRLVVRPGAKVPVDGRVIEGSSDVDESAMSGEAIPVSKSAGDAVIAGTVNGRGRFVFEAERVGEHTLLAQVVALVRAAQRTRPDIQRIADRVVQYFVPLVLAISAVAFLIWYAVGPEPQLTYALLSAVSVLIIACPCAVGLATPMSIAVGTARAAKLGVLVRDAQALEALAQVDLLAIDKTGTLTEGIPSVVGVATANGFDEANMLTYAAALESASEHPLALAIVKEAADRSLSLPPQREFVATPGAGASALVNDDRVTLGNAAMMEHTESLYASLSALDVFCDSQRQAGNTIIYVASNDVLMGAIAIGDQIKPEAAATLDAIRRAGVEIVILTGDHAQTTQAIADNLGVSEFYAGCRPADKLAHIHDCGRRGTASQWRAMALTMRRPLPWQTLASRWHWHRPRQTKRGGDAVRRRLKRPTTRSGLEHRHVEKHPSKPILRVFYNAIGIPIAAGVLFPAFGWLLSPMLAAAAMSLSSVSVIMNALRLRSVKISTSESRVRDHTS